MRHLIYIPAFLAIATVSAHAQDGQTGQGQTNPSLDSQSRTYGESGQEQGALGQSQGGMETEFTEVDKDGDGYLSIAEAGEALPEVDITDTDGDGLLSKSEVESALPGVSFEQGGEAEAGEEPYIGEEEYDQIVQTMEADSGRQGV